MGSGETVPRAGRPRDSRRDPSASLRASAGATVLVPLLLVMTACGGGSSSSNVVTPVVTSISMSPTNPSITVGSTTQFAATAAYSDGSSKTVTSSATWTTTDPTVASIESTGQATPGLASGVAPGNVNITATFSGFSAVTPLNVTGTSGTLTSFALSQIKPTIAPKATLQMFGYATYSDNSTQWVTSTTHWTSSNTSVATVQDSTGASPGLVTAGSSSGTTTITGTFQGLSQSTVVTIAANAVPIDLMDMNASQNYLHFAGGLYENSSDTVPSDHDADGKAAAAEIQPLDQNGSPSAKGAVVFLGIGMSNADEEFSAFAGKVLDSGSGANQTTLAAIDGAMGAATACYWTVAQGQTGSTCPDAKGVLLDNQYDRVRDSVLATTSTVPPAPSGCGTTSKPCFTEAQVQVLWIKNANPRPGPAGTRTLCDATVSGCVNDTGTEAILYESQLGQTIRAARSRYPNLKQIFLATRIYAGYATDGLNPEPYAYEYGYSAKWLIEAQIIQERNGTIDPVAGNMSYTNGTAAWTAWGTYIWADGSIARSDGLAWLSSDFQSDGTHPNASGTTKVVDQLMGFFLGSPYTPWFRP